MYSIISKFIIWSFDDFSFPKGWANKWWCIDFIPKLWTVDWREYAIIGFKIHLANSMYRGKTIRFRISFINKLKVHLSFQFGKDVTL